MNKILFAIFPLFIGVFGYFPSSPVLWVESKDKKVTKTIVRVEYISYIDNPCQVFLSKELHSPDTYEICNRDYEKEFLTPIKLLCDRLLPSNSNEIKAVPAPFKPSKGLIRRKRFIIIGGIIAFVVISSFLFGTIGFSMSISNRVMINEMDDKINKMKKVIDDGVDNFDKIRADLELLKKGFDLVNASFVEVRKEIHTKGYTISVIVDIMRENARTLQNFVRYWQEGQIYYPFFEMMHWNTVLEHGIFKIDPYTKLRPYGNCRFNFTTQKLVVHALKQETSRQYKILEARPFTLVKKINDKYCSFEYIGPQYLIYSKQSKCTSKWNYNKYVKDGMLWEPDYVNCGFKEESSKDMANWKMIECYSWESIKNYHFFQIMWSEDHFYIYSKFYNISINEHPMISPDYVFALSTNERISWGNHSANAEIFEFGKIEEYDPALNKLANEMIFTEFGNFYKEFNKSVIETEISINNTIKDAKILDTNFENQHSSWDFYKSIHGVFTIIGLAFSLALLISIVVWIILKIRRNSYRHRRNGHNNELELENFN